MTSTDHFAPFRRGIESSRLNSDDFIAVLTGQATGNEAPSKVVDPGLLPERVDLHAEEHDGMISREDLREAALAAFEGGPPVTIRHMSLHGDVCFTEAGVYFEPGGILMTMKGHVVTASFVPRVKYERFESGGFVDGCAKGGSAMGCFPPQSLFSRDETPIEGHDLVTKLIVPGEKELIDFGRCVEMVATSEDTLRQIVGYLSEYAGMDPEEVMQDPKSFAGPLGQHFEALATRGHVSSVQLSHPGYWSKRPRAITTSLSEEDIDAVYDMLKLVVDITRQVAYAVDEALGLSPDVHERSFVVRQVGPESGYVRGVQVNKSIGPIGAEDLFASYVPEVLKNHGMRMEQVLASLMSGQSL